METKNVYEKLLSVQNMLKAPKSQYNAFGKYNYRNCEDILEAVKPLCKEVKALVYLTDEIVMVGERYYVQAKATFIDVENDGIVCAIAYAREEETKKGMDGSQVTGASSSYARKYALNGLFDIDDTKDSDTTNTHEKDIDDTKDSDTTNTHEKDTDAPKKQKTTPPKQDKPKTYRELVIDELNKQGIDSKTYAIEKGLTKDTPEEKYMILLAELTA